jgi:hypothetical protein
MDNTRSKQEVNWARGSVLAGLAVAVIRTPLDAGLAAATWVIAGIAINHVAWYASMA